MLELMHNMLHSVSPNFHKIVHDDIESVHSYP